MVGVTDREEREIVEASDTALSRLESDFRNEPYRFFSELDAQRHYCRLLESELASRSVSTQVRNGDGHVVTLVHQDYGSAQKGGHRTDIAILRPCDLRRSRGTSMRVENAYAQPLVALEFGTEKSEQPSRSGSGMDLCAHTERDFRKLTGTGALNQEVVICYRNFAGQRHRIRDKRILEERVGRLRKSVEDLALMYPQVRVRLVVADLEF